MKRLLSAFEPAERTHKLIAMLNLARSCQLLAALSQASPCSAAWSRLQHISEASSSASTSAASTSSPSAASKASSPQSRSPRSTSKAQRSPATGQHGGPSRKQRAMPRVIQHVTKAQALAESLPPHVDVHGPLASLISEQGGAGPSYDDESLLKHIAGKRGGALDARRAELVRLLRRYNYSLPGLHGQSITATVLRVGEASVFVDPGFFGVSEVPRSEVGLGHLLTPDGQLPADRTSASDIRPGDTISVQIDSLFTPFGDMQVGSRACLPCRSAGWDSSSQPGGNVHFLSHTRMLTHIHTHSHTHAHPLPLLTSSTLAAGGPAAGLRPPPRVHLARTRGSLPVSHARPGPRAQRLHWRLRCGDRGPGGADALRAVHLRNGRQRRRAPEVRG